MRKIILVIFSMIFIGAFADEVIQLGIKYNEATARTEAFRDVQRKISKDFYRQYLKDENRVENLDFIAKKQYETGLGRSLCPFYLKTTLASYAIVYHQNPQYNFYYNIFGSLVKFDVVEQGDYPKRTFGYSRYGNLISVAFEVSEQEQFMYDEDGKLLAHWIDDTAYNKDNKTPKFIKLKRGSVE